MKRYNEICLRCRGTIDIEREIFYDPFKGTLILESYLICEICFKKTMPIEYARVKEKIKAAKEIEGILKDTIELLKGNIP